MGDARHVDGGVTSAAEARLAEGGLIAVQGPGLLDARTGVAFGPGSAALVTGTSATGTMTVQIGVHHAVTTRGSANGVYLGPVLAAVQTVNIAAAPGTGSRIDVVYVKQQDATSGVPSPDVTTAPLYGVVTGTAGSTPAKPSLTSIAGAEELATVTVAAGATSTNGSGVTIANTARQTVARGARVPVRTQAERDALTAFAGLEVYRLDTGQVQLCTAAGSPGTWVTVFDPAAPPRASKAYSVGPYTGLAVNGSTNTLFTLAIPDPGWSYRLAIDAFHQALVSPGDNWNFTARIDSTSGTLIQPVGVATSTTYAPVYIIGGLSPVLSGAHSVLFNAERVSGAAGDGYQVNTVTNLQGCRVQVIPA